MADPDDGQNDTGHKHIRPHHHKEADPHHQRHRDDDAQLGLHRHPLFLYKGFKVLLIQLGTHKPISLAHPSVLDGIDRIRNPYGGLAVGLALPPPPDAERQ